jgi:hypothetical protein
MTRIWGKWLKLLSRNSVFVFPFQCKVGTCNIEARTLFLITNRCDRLICKVKLSCYRHEGAKRERRSSFYSFLISALERGRWSASRPSRALPPRKDTRYTLDRVGGPQSWYGHRGYRLCLCRGSSPDRPACSQTLYWLSYLGFIRSNTYQIHAKAYG